MHILFGSVTGTAENVARSAAKVAKARGHEVALSELDDVSMEDLAAMDDVLVVISTYGEGEMPFNAEMFWDEIGAAPPVLKGLRYGVLALGDTAYEQFCQAGKDIDAKFAELGAERTIARADCDLNYEKTAEEWIDRAIPVAGEGGGATDAAPVALEEAAEEGWSRARPFPASLVENRLLSGAGSTKEMRHIVLSLEGSGIAYEAGDCLAVVPQNAPDLVRALLQRLNKTWHTRVAGYDLPLGELLSAKFEILTPSQDLVAGVAAVVEDEALRAAVAGGRETQAEYLWGKDVLDILNIDPRLVVSAEILLPLLSPLQHRAYSIASTPLTAPDAIHLTVSTVRWAREGRDYGGVCSTHFADRLELGEGAGVFLVPNKRFRLPADGNTPIIMVGPGTGIAPYLGFLEERRATGARGAAWLFTGDRHRATDHVYQAELQSFSEAGVLTHLELAFSRDQAEKVYVSDLLRARGAEVYNVIETGAHVYLCGDATSMAPGVEAALVDIIAEHGAMMEAYAKDRLAQLRRQGRYLKDVY
ncbi:MAG: sulfite reductase flavoprotein subunit alpha [Pseudomonadota bacterium]